MKFIVSTSEVLSLHHNVLAKGTSVCLLVLFQDLKYLFGHSVSSTFTCNKGLLACDLLSVGFCSPCM